MGDEVPLRRIATGKALTITYLWLGTRVLLLLMVLDILPVFHSVSWDVVGVYNAWHQTLKTGTLPVGDVTWQYPPAAALVIWAPGMLPFDYFNAFLVIVVAFDALTMAALVRAPAVADGHTRAGAWVWLFGVPLLGPVVYARFDLIVAAIAVSGLLQLSASPLRYGVTLGIGAGLKLWPAVALLGAPPGRATVRALAGAAAGAGVSTLLVLLAFRGSGLDFITAQRGRGVEVESVWALGFHVARWFGWPGMVSYNYGSMEMLGPYAEGVARLSLAATLAGLSWLLYWRGRAETWTAATPVDAAMAAILLFVVTSRVISPQYMVWLVGLAAACLAVRGTSQRPVAALVLAATAATMLEFPLLFDAVQASTPLGVAILALRNGLLLAAAAVSCRRLWRATVPRPAPA
ncbi:glycosyltransferase 87 family protein [Sphaerisporangium sp. TRM90804]|uniref:glycosyltransferase 87 family protein n=1 Tax=Sphaerisporangium sp. TRM90804 TaxID=3031113 RepID=UPI002446FC6E|nr:glycosyltransferase 87 family protein [Sphaerisporangium sp. TRM90804]MDH2427490.1 glycosyltransferase 87 family protein [Sphaerisporangium sp. TRM90804]